MLIDTHTHIYLEHFDDDRHDIIKKCKALDIQKLLLPNIDVSTISALHKTCEEYPILILI